MKLTIAQDDHLLQRFTIADRKAVAKQLSRRFAIATSKSLSERSIVCYLRKRVSARDDLVRSHIDAEHLCRLVSGW